MAREIRARIIHGKIEPLEDVDLPEGEEVVVLVKYKSGKETFKQFLERTAGSWEGTLDFDEFLKYLHDRRKKMRRAPVDFD